MTRIRLAGPDDAPAVQAIYAPYVRSTSISFELQEPSVAEMGQRLEFTLRRFPWLVAEDDGGVTGYACAGPHRERAAYQWSVDVSVYVRMGSHRRGVGTALYTELLGILRDLGYCNAYAGITLPNPGSVALHEKMGFLPVAVYREVGFKLGRWHDVGWWHLALRPRDVPPAPPRGIAAGLEIARLRGATDEDLRRHDEELARRRRQWYRREGRLLHAGVSDPLERAYLVLLAKLGIEPSDAPIASRDGRRLVFHSANPCPTLEACLALGLDTRAVCRLSSERAVDVLVKEVDPRLRFRRDYDRLRPRASACVEMIEYAEEGP